MKKGTILVARTSAVLKPWEYSLTCAISCRSGLVIAKLIEGRRREGREEGKRGEERGTEERRGEESGTEGRERRGGREREVDKG